MVATVVGVTAVAISLAVRPNSPISGEDSSSLQHASTELRILPEHPLTYHELRLQGALIQAGSLGAVSSSNVSAPGPTVVWSVNGQEVHRGPKLTPEYFHRGDEIQARVEVPGVGGAAQVQAVASSRIANARPRIQAVAVQRDDQDPRWLKADVQTIDSDDDPLTLEYRWTANGRPLRRAEGNRVLTEDLRPGQKVQVEVTASDGDLRSEPLQSQPVALDNHAPDLAIDGTPRMEHAKNGDLVAHMKVRARDLDGDAVKVVVLDAPDGFRWDDAEHALVWTIADGNQSVDVTLRVSDSRGATAQRTVTVRR
jgi:hypothetical protein